MKSFTHLALALLLAALAGSGCTERAVSVIPPDPAIVTLTPAFQALDAGDSVKLNAVVKNVTGAVLTWTLSSPGATDIGTITSAGMYHAPDAISGDSLVVMVRASIVSETASGVARVTVRPGPLRGLRRPGVGSTYTYSFFRFDTSGRKEVGSDRVVRNTINRTFVNYAGRDSVVEVGTDSLILPHSIRYMADGSILMYDVNPQIVWLALPFNGGPPVGVTLTDSIYGNGAHYTRRIETSYLGTEIVTMGDKRFLTQKVRYRYEEKKTVRDSYTLSVDENFWFAPALGWCTRIDEVLSYEDPADKYSFGWRAFLTSYDVK